MLVRLQPDQLAKLDAFRKTQDDSPSRPEAIRRLLSEGATAPHLRQAIRQRDDLREALERDLARNVAAEYREMLEGVIADHRARLRELDEQIADLISDADIFYRP